MEENSAKKGERAVAASSKNTWTDTQRKKRKKDEPDPC